MRGFGPRCGVDSFARTPWGSVERNAMPLPSVERYLNPMFIAPTTSLSMVNPLLSLANLTCIFNIFTLLPPLNATRITEGMVFDWLPAKRVSR